MGGEGMERWGGGGGGGGVHSGLGSWTPSNEDPWTVAMERTPGLLASGSL